MNISNLLKKNCIIVDLKASDKLSALKEIASFFALQNDHVNANTILKVLLDRENLGSTGIGDGIAIPHGKLGGFEEIFVGFGRSRKGVDFDALDGKPVHLFFILIAPESAVGQHLKVLAKLSRMLMDPGFRADLMNAVTADDLFKTITDMDHQVLSTGSG
jgi:PTS system nitrogen regulatory IIA component